jgi:hypothetical protein
MAGSVKELQIPSEELPWEGQQIENRKRGNVIALNPHILDLG